MRIACLLLLTACMTEPAPPPTPPEVPAPTAEVPSPATAPAEAPPTSPADPTRHRLTLPLATFQPIMDDPIAHSRTLRVRPHHDDDGQPVGMLVTRADPDSIVADLGLQQGDVVRTLDGRPLTSLEDVVSTVRAHPHDQPWVLTWTRGDQAHTLELTITR